MLICRITYFFFWPLHCLFFDKRILIAPLVSSNFSSRNCCYPKIQVCIDIYVFMYWTIKINHCYQKQGNVYGVLFKWKKTIILFNFLAILVSNISRRTELTSGVIQTYRINERGSICTLVIISIYQCHTTYRHIYTK